MVTRTWLVGTVTLVLVGAVGLACGKEEKRPPMTPDSENPTLKMLEDDAKGANDEPDDTAADGGPESTGEGSDESSGDEQE